MPRKPIDPMTINWDSISQTLNSGKTNFKTLGKLTGVSASTIRRMMLSRYGTNITLTRGRTVGGVVWTDSTKIVHSLAPVAPVGAETDI
jgi:hypothetical protein